MTEDETSFLPHFFQQNNLSSNELTTKPNRITLLINPVVRKYRTAEID
jgi:hypothetical protein